MAEDIQTIKANPQPSGNVCLLDQSDRDGMDFLVTSPLMLSPTGKSIFVRIWWVLIIYVKYMRYISVNKQCMLKFNE